MKRKKCINSEEIMFDLFQRASESLQSLTAEDPAKYEAMNEIVIRFHDFTNREEFPDFFKRKSTLNT